MSSFISYLGSERFSIILLKAGILLAALFTILWIAETVPPAPYMIWGPFSLWLVLFLINLSISLLKRKYCFKGNLFFHMAFLLAGLGILVSSLLRFEGSAVVLEGDSFFGERSEYLRRPQKGPFASYPSLSFTLKDIEAGYWQDQLYFIKLEGRIAYPAGDPEREGIVRLNGGVGIDGTRLRLKGYGLFPEVRIEEGGSLLFNGPLRVLVFPPGSEDSVELGGYRLKVKLFPQGVVEDGVLKNRGMSVKTPFLPVEVEWLGGKVYRGALRLGERLRFGRATMTFTGIREWVEVGIVKDPGEWIVFASFILALTGLIMRGIYLWKGAFEWEFNGKVRSFLFLLLSGQAFYIGMRWMKTGHPPILGTFEEALSASFAVTLFALFFDRKGRLSMPALFIVFLTLFYGLFFDRSERPLVISEQSYWVYFHALFAWIAYGFYTFATMGAVKVIAGSSETYFFSIMERGITNGLIFHTIMFVLGSYYSSRLHGRWWMWDPVEYLFLASWFLYAIPVHGRIFFRWDRRKMARWVVFAFLGTMILYWGLVYFPWATYHVFDPQWKTHRGLAP